MHFSTVSSFTVSQHMLEGLWYESNCWLLLTFIEYSTSWSGQNLVTCLFILMLWTSWRITTENTMLARLELEMQNRRLLNICLFSLAMSLFANYLENNNKPHSNTETNWKLRNCTKLTAQSWFSESKQILQWWKQLKCRSQSSATSLFKWLRLEIVIFPGM